MSSGEIWEWESISFVSGFPSEMVADGHILKSLVENGGKLQLKKIIGQCLYSVLSKEIIRNYKMIQEFLFILIWRVIWNYFI